MKKEKLLNKQRSRRSFAVRKRLRGTADRPRLSVFRSARHICAQLIDDSAGKTLVSASTLEKSMREEIAYGGNQGAAAAVGKVVAERALAAGVKQVKFDRGNFRYHGRVAALADAAREAGLDF